ncbi:MAG: AAA family ATPase, partial [Proteobacteria bacterium]|nr:AAA family ATPase [Pseudomonadota bacterium]
MMIARKIMPIVRARLRTYPAVAVVGPRQCGKTTLAQSLGGRYFDLEQEPDRLRLDLQWDELVATRELVVLDEAQTWPDVFA